MSTVNKQILCVIAFLMAAIVANLTVAAYGPSVIYLNSFLLIGLSITVRDTLHDLWAHRNLRRNMLLLIGAGSLISYALNRDAGRIALASFLAFASEGLVDTVTYSLLRDRDYLVRINGSNVFAALTDSVVFIIIAFGFPVLWLVVLKQFAAKAAGGFLWSLVLNWKKRNTRSQWEPVTVEISNY